MSVKKIIFSLFKKGVRLFSGHKLTRFYPLKVLYYSLLTYLRDHQSPVDVLGNKMFLDSIDTLGLSVRGIYEPLETELVKKEIKEGDVVIDIGGNIGYYTLIFAKLVGNTGQVFAFEPDPTNFSLLEKNIRLNRYKNVTLVKKAVSDKTGIATLYLSQYNKGAHTIRCNAYDAYTSIEIETIRLDDYFKEYNRTIDFIKMDIEGAEDLAIKGMDSLLEKNRNIKIMTEFCPLVLKRFGVDPKQHLQSFINRGFTLYHIDEQQKSVRQANVSELMQKYHDGYTNLLCK